MSRIKPVHHRGYPPKGKQRKPRAAQAVFLLLPSPWIAVEFECYSSRIWNMKFAPVLRHFLKVCSQALSPTCQSVVTSRGQTSRVNDCQKHPQTVGEEARKYIIRPIELSTSSWVIAPQREQVQRTRPGWITHG